MTDQDLSQWSARDWPPNTVLAGRYVRLEPLDADRHGAELFAASNVTDKEEKFRWLFEGPPSDEASFIEWTRREAARRDCLPYAVIDLESGQVAGRQSLMRIDVNNGGIEIGAIYWGPRIARRQGATEAVYLFMKHVFEDLGYRRFEWKCHNDNTPSKRAAERFGFTYEGLFRQHMVIKGKSRDTAWYSIIDKEWPELKAGFEAWLDLANFDDQGGQRRGLSAYLDRT
ncbi:Protein N-acetyltransferase, RimJ/RimL family [Cohaesibacter sp. ES.047]|uniref:GNAT family N-acetyltransferase n=1 Tax=Cohaesibacter sp. ES.047 TaxID=1798205 RepID=UPI000BC01C62|nr:Protein N-acetyltransferase, RimJ/RimL family [Cohaesibacter sp. ES.047]